MYTPSHFAMNDPAELTRFIQEHSFGILCSTVQGRPFATHLPLLLDPAAGAQGRLLTHFARANPHWRELDGAEVLVVFAGPHAYISPSWYVESQAVPTWNYVAVHVYGTCRLVQDDQRLHELLAQTVRYYEPHSPLLEHLHEEFYTKLAKGVVGVEIEITSIEGKAKLSQNRSAESYQGVIDGLRATQDSEAAAVANLMETIRK
jgi:transcriptional regulator